MAIDSLETIVQRMIDAGESEENIATVIQGYQEVAEAPTPDPLAAASKATKIGPDTNDTWLPGERKIDAAFSAATGVPGIIVGGAKKVVEAVNSPMALFHAAGDYLGMSNGESTETRRGMIPIDTEPTNLDQRLGSAATDAAMLAPGAAGGVKAVDTAVKVAKNPTVQKVATVAGATGLGYAEGGLTGAAIGLMGGGAFNKARKMLELFTGTGKSAEAAEATKVAARAEKLKAAFSKKWEGAHLPGQDPIVPMSVHPTASAARDMNSELGTLLTQEQPALDARFPLTNPDPKGMLAPDTIDPELWGRGALSQDARARMTMEGRNVPPATLDADKKMWADGLAKKFSGGKLGGPVSAPSSLEAEMDAMLRHGTRPQGTALPPVIQPGETAGMATTIDGYVPQAPGRRAYSSSGAESAATAEDIASKKTAVGVAGATKTSDPIKALVKAIEKGERRVLTTEEMSIPEVGEAWRARQAKINGMTHAARPAHLSPALRQDLIEMEMRRRNK